MDMMGHFTTLNTMIPKDPPPATCRTQNTYPWHWWAPLLDVSANVHRPTPPTPPTHMRAHHHRRHTPITRLRAGTRNSQVCRMKQVNGQRACLLMPKPKNKKDYYPRGRHACSADTNGGGNNKLTSRTRSQPEPTCLSNDTTRAQPSHRERHVVSDALCLGVSDKTL